MPLDQSKLNKAVERTEAQAWTEARKECQACHEVFATLRRWEKRCDICRELDKPYTKRIYSNDAPPF